MGALGSGLVVDSVSVSYATLAAVRNVSLNVGDGEFVAIIGANGAGKSSLLKAIMGLVRSSSGSVTFRDHALTGLEPHAIVAKGIAYVPEGRRLFPQLSVEENLRMGAPRKCEDLAQRLGSAYEAFPLLAERRSQIAGTLSGGEQQMLAIGRAMLAGPSMLLIDEPSFGLSPTAVDALLETVAKLNREGVGILLAEQTVEIALDVAHRTYVFENGHVSAAGLSSEIRADPVVKRAYLGSAG